MYFANGSVSENYIHFLPSWRCCMTMILLDKKFLVISLKTVNVCRVA